MGTEDSHRPSYPFRPPAANISAQRNPTPFDSSWQGAESDFSAFRPVLPAASNFQMPTFSGGYVAGPEAPGLRPSPSNIPREQIRPPSLAPPYGTPSSISQNFPPPLSNQVLPSHAFITEQTPVRPDRPPVPGPPPVSLLSQPQPQSMPIGSPPQNFKPGHYNPNIPGPAQQLFSPSGSVAQPTFRQPYVMGSDTVRPSFSGYANAPSSSASHGAPVGPPASLPNIGSYAPASTASPYFPQVVYPSPPIPSSSGTIYPGNQVPQVGFVPPVSTSQGLTEDFSSLNIGSAPGSFDGGADSATLPRPLDGDTESDPLSETYPANCSSRFVRLSTSGIPNSQSLSSRWHLPLGVVVCPLAESLAGDEVPVVNFATTGIVRCRRCRTYVNPYVVFTDNGRKWRCNICSFLNDVPGEYFAHIDASGRRVDVDERPELTKGSVDFIAPAEYMVRPPMPPTYFFLIDVSLPAVKSGVLEVMAQTIKSCLDRLPGYPRTQIGFITFDSTIHFYNLKSSLMQPQMMVISDLDDVFVPLPDDLLVNLSESRNVVESFLDMLPAMFQDNLNVESAFGPSLKAAFMVMSQLGGKLLIFQNTLPSLGVGRLRLRGDDIKLNGTDKEHTLRIAEDPFYKQMAADLNKFQIAVNIYSFSDKYTDIASLGTLAKYTGGQVYYYPNFHSSIHKDRLQHELSRDLTRETAWESVMRIRCGKGIRFTSYHGNFMMRSTDLISLPAVDCDKAYAAQLSLEDTLLTTSTVFFQVALLYTSSSGERRIRVHTAAAPVVTDLGQMYQMADVGAIVSLLARLAIERTLSYKLEDARNSVQLRIVKALREFRTLYGVQHRLTGRIIYPDSLKLLPLYGLALSKSLPLRGGYTDARLDERCAAGFTMMALPVKKLLKLLYPSLVRVDDILVKTGELENVSRLPLTVQSLDSRGLYILDNGFQFVIWFGASISPDIAKNLLVEDFSQDFSKVNLSLKENAISRKLMEILDKYRQDDPSYFQLCHLVRQGEQPREGYYLLNNLVEDKTGGANGYPDWMLLVHRQVQQNA